jgi:hypothetical protein
VLLKREARAARNRIRTLALVAQYGFTSLDEACDALLARLKARGAAATTLEGGRVGESILE